jgi:hypothetical protein
MEFIKKEYKKYKNITKIKTQKQKQKQKQSKIQLAFIYQAALPC